MQNCLTACKLAIALVWFAGCSDGRPTRVPVSGQVLIDGQPLTHGNIKFIAPAGRASHGELNEQGRFELSCFEKNDGALIGTHQVAITSAKAINQNETRWLAPKKYADPRTSGLTQEITEPVDDLVIDLSWNGGHEFVEKEVGGGGGEEGMPGRRRKKAESN